MTNEKEPPKTQWEKTVEDRLNDLDKRLSILENEAKQQQFEQERVIRRKRPS